MSAIWAEDELLDDEERETAPMTDAEHVRLFGWGWDDPAKAEA